MDYYQLIDEYLNSQRHGITPKTREAERKAITLGVDFLKQRGLDAPNDDFFEAMKADLLKNYQNSTVHKKYMPPIRRFFEWTKQKGDAPMKDIPPYTLQQEAKTAAPLPSVDNDKYSTRRKPGRKMRQDEPRTEKISIYLTPSLLSDAQDLARIDSLRFADYVYSLIQQDASTRRAKIEALRALRA